MIKIVVIDPSEMNGTRRFYVQDKDAKGLFDHLNTHPFILIKNAKDGDKVVYINVQHVAYVETESS